MRQLLCAALLVLTATVVFSEGNAETPWRVVDAGDGEVYAFTQAVSGCGMLTVDFIKGRKVKFIVNCDALIDSDWNAKVVLSFDGGGHLEKIWRQTDDHTAVFLEESIPSDFLALLEHASLAEVSVFARDGKRVDWRFAVKGISAICGEKR